MTVWQALIEDIDDQALDALAQLLEPRLRGLGDQTPAAAEQALTPDEAAERYAVSRQTIYRALRDGRLRGTKPEGTTTWRIAPSDLDAWAVGATSTTASITRRAGSRGRGQPSSAAAVAAIAGAP